MSFKKILWPTDGSKPALHALQTAVKLAQTFQADLFALQVVPRVPMLSQKGFAPPAPMSFDVPLYERELLEISKKNLESALAENVPAGTGVESTVELGQPDELIIDFVRRKKVDLIVMAIHGRSGFSHFFLGSVAEKIIRKSPVPVLAIPMNTEES